MKNFQLKRCVTILAVLLLLVLASGCGQQKTEITNRQKSEVEAAVTWYLALMTDGYRNLNMNPLIQVATRRQATKTYHHMASLGEAGLKMDATLKKIEFGTVQNIAPDKAEVATQEEWEYVYQSVKTGKPLFDNSVNYSLLYQLEQQAGKWLVSDITVTRTKERKDSSFIFQRPADIPPGRSTKQQE